MTTSSLTLSLSWDHRTSYLRQQKDLRAFESRNVCHALFYRAKRGRGIRNVRLSTQSAYFSSNITRTYEWRIEQLDRMGRMIAESESDLQKAMAQDFKTASQEYVFETLAELGEVEFQKSQLKAWMEPVEAPVPRFLAKTGHKGMVYRELYGVTLIIGPFNGPLTLLVRPALTALGAGNTCILKLPESLSETSALLLKLVPKYFDPRAVAAVAGHREEVGELLKLPFDFIFFTGSGGGRLRLRGQSGAVH
jgi:aldehyde dehydrogenase (NAD+)